MAISETTADCVTAAAFRCTVCVLWCNQFCMRVCWQLYINLLRSERPREECYCRRMNSSFTRRRKVRILAIVHLHICCHQCHLFCRFRVYLLTCLVWVFLHLPCTVSGLESFCHQQFKLWFKLSWQKQVSVRFCRIFLPKHSKCSNIIDKSSPSLFAEQTQTGHCLLSFQPGVT